MTNVKQTVSEVMNSLPDDCTIEDVLSRLEIRAKLERGDKEIAEGRYVSHEEAVRRMHEWLESSGPTER